MIAQKGSNLKILLLKISNQEWIGMINQTTIHVNIDILIRIRQTLYRPKCDNKVYHRGTNDWSSKIENKKKSVK
jgi:hypothetical protein